MVEAPVLSRVRQDIPPDLTAILDAEYPQASSKLAKLASFRPDAYEHSLRTSWLSGAITAALEPSVADLPDNIDPITVARITGLFHDIGNSRVPYRHGDDALRWQHVDHTVTICRKIGFPLAYLQIIGAHHDAFLLDPSADYPAGPSFRRTGNLPITFPDRRQPVPAGIARLSLVVWTADKTDKAYASGLTEGETGFPAFRDRFEANFPPGFKKLHRDLFRAANESVRLLFFMNGHTS